MHKFWDDNQTLTEPEMRLVGALYHAHAQCVFRENCSTMALQQAAFGSRDLVKSYIAALATLGDVHGPVVEAYRVLAGESQEPDRVAGFGNSFIKGKADPVFVKVHEALEAGWPEIIKQIEKQQSALLLQGKDLHPNPACYTAAVAIALGMPPNLAPSLFVQARLEPWTALFFQVMKQNNNVKEEV